MPKIISSTELRNEYNAVSSWCKDTNEAAFVTKNGSGDLAVMGIDAYDELAARASLYDKLLEGRSDVMAGRVSPAEEVIERLKERIS